jgi:hypothetical protein
MKKLITFTLAATLTITVGLANSTKPYSISSPVAKPTSASLITLAAVSSENQLLNAKLVALETESAELQSQISYQQMMAKMLTSLSVLENDEAIQEVRANVQYVSTMTNVLLAIQSISNLEQQQELKAQIEFQKIMQVVLTKLNSSFAR